MVVVAGKTVDDDERPHMDTWRVVRACQRAKYCKSAVSGNNERDACLCALVCVKGLISS